MYRKRFRLLATAAVCVALALLSTERLAQAEQPETVSVTFALEVPCFPQYEDPAPQLSDYVGEDTVAILIGDLYESGGVDYLYFDEFSPPCGDVDVADTAWYYCGGGTIVNKGGPIYGTVWWWMTPQPGVPEHSALVAQKITEVDACWLKFDSAGEAVAQHNWDWDTSAVFVIVTGEFRVKE